MKNALKYFYDIDINDIRQKDNKYIFESGNQRYSLENYQSEERYIEDIYNLNKYMQYNQIPVYQIVPNKFNDIIMKYNSKIYILILIDNKYDQSITFDDLKKYQFKINNIKRIIDWKGLWMDKIDYFEYQMNQSGMKYPLIRESMGYFIGMAENAISMLNEKISIDKLYLQHRRITINSTRYDLLNPLNIIIDVGVRDISEYFKSDFFYGNNKEILENFMNYIQNMYYNNNELVLLYIRLFFPTFYFDQYEQIITGIDSNKKLNIIIKKIDNYERILKKITFSIDKIVSLPNVAWIKK